MKSSLFKLLFIFILLFSQNLYADTCDESFDAFNQSTDKLLNRNMLSYDDLNKFSDSFLELQVMTENEPCYKKTMEDSKSLRLKIKNKRIETIKKYMALKIYEEAGSDLVSELGILTGAKVNKKYAFDDLFSFGTTKKKPVEKDYEKIVKDSVKNKISQNNKCSNIVNQNEAVNLTNVRNQDGVGWCYAYVAADLLSYRLKKKISAVSLYNSGQSIEENIANLDGNGGRIEDAIAGYLAKNQGLCLEEDLPSSDFKFCTYKNYVNFLNALYRTGSEGKIASTQCLEKNLNEAFPGVSSAFLNNYIEANGTRDLAEYLYGLKCMKKSFVGYQVKPSVTSAQRVDKDLMINNIDNLLSKGEIIGLSYNYNLLEENEDKVGNHASIIVGRRLNQETGDCEYLVRNSWGSDCAIAESRGFSCQKTCNDNGSDCRNTGHFWVNQIKLKKAMMATVTLP